MERLLASTTLLLLLALGAAHEPWKGAFECDAKKVGAGGWMFGGGCTMCVCVCVGSIVGVGFFFLVLRRTGSIGHAGERLDDGSAGSIDGWRDGSISLASLVDRHS